MFAVRVLRVRREMMLPFLLIGSTLANQVTYWGNSASRRHTEHEDEQWWWHSASLTQFCDSWNPEVCSWIRRYVSDPLLRSGLPRSCTVGASALLTIPVLTISPLALSGALSHKSGICSWLAFIVVLSAFLTLESVLFDPLPRLSNTSALNAAPAVLEALSSGNDHFDDKPPTPTVLRGIMAPTLQLHQTGAEWIAERFKVPRAACDHCANAWYVTSLILGTSYSELIVVCNVQASIYWLFPCLFELRPLSHFVVVV
jgi:hypothetical protein